MNIKSGANKHRLFIILICVGVALMAIGAVAGRYMQDDALAGRMLGFGAGFGSAVAAVGAVGHIRARKKPDMARRQEIDARDERSIKIREKSAYGVYFVTMFSLAAAAFVFVCMNLMTACLITVAVLLIHCLTYFALLYRNDKTL